MPYLIEDAQATEHPAIAAARAAGRARGLEERAKREKAAFAQSISERNAKLQEEEHAANRDRAAFYQRIAEQQNARAERRGLLEDKELALKIAERSQPKPPKVDPGEIRGRTRYTIGEVARGTGLNLHESQINALADALEPYPEQLAALPGLLKDDATYQKNAKQHEELMKALSGATVPEVEKLNEMSPLVAASPLGFLIQKLRMQRTPRVLALVNDAETPSVQEMDVNEAKENGYGIITQKDGGYLLDGEPIAAPAAPAPLLQRLFQDGQGAPQPAPAAPSDVVTRTLRDGTTVRVRKAADGTWQEVE